MLSPVGATRRGTLTTPARTSAKLKMSPRGSTPLGLSGQAQKGMRATRRPLSMLLLPDRARDVHDGRQRHHHDVLRRQGIDAATRSHLHGHAADAALRRVDAMCQLRQAAQQIITEGRLDTSSAPSCATSASAPHFQQQPVTASAPTCLYIVLLRIYVCLFFSTVCVLRAGHAYFAEQQAPPDQDPLSASLRALVESGGAPYLPKRAPHGPAARATKNASPAQRGLRRE